MAMQHQFGKDVSDEEMALFKATMQENLRILGYTKDEHAIQKIK
jgi:hypothetical protein